MTPERTERTPKQLTEMLKVFDGYYPTVGEAFRHLHEKTQPVATPKRLLLVSRHNLEHTPRRHFIKRWRLKQYIDELQAVAQ